MKKAIVVSRLGKQAQFPHEKEWRRLNMSRLLVTASWIADHKVLKYVNANGFPMLRMAHLHIPRNLDLHGTTLTELANRAEMTKQSMGALVDEFEAFGLIERLPSQTDRRTKLVRFTARGLRLLAVGRKAIAAFELDVLESIGSKRMLAIVDGLTRYCDSARVDFSVGKALASKRANDTEKPNTSFFSK